MELVQVRLGGQVRGTGHVHKARLPDARSLLLTMHLVPGSARVSQCPALVSGPVGSGWGGRVAGFSLFTLMLCEGLLGVWLTPLYRCGN